MGKVIMLRQPPPSPRAAETGPGKVIKFPRELRPGRPGDRFELMIDQVEREIVEGMRKIADELEDGTNTLPLSVAAGLRTWMLINRKFDAAVALTRSRDNVGYGQLFRDLDFIEQRRKAALEAWIPDLAPEFESRSWWLL